MIKYLGKTPPTEIAAEKTPTIVNAGENAHYREILGKTHTIRIVGVKNARYSECWGKTPTIRLLA